jgi:hypothetical protein
MLGCAARALSALPVAAQSDAHDISAGDIRGRTSHETRDVILKLLLHICIYSHLCTPCLARSKHSRTTRPRTTAEAR